jgi:cytochrome P450
MPALMKFKLDKIFLPTLSKGTADFEALSKAQSSWRVAQSDLEDPDLFRELLKARDPETGRSLTPEELVAEAGVLIIAGTDTSVIGITSTIFYLLHCERANQRLKEEIRGAFASREDIRIGAQLHSCKYMFACIDEAMRLSPPVGAVLSRQILAGGLLVDGQRLPTGIEVGVSAYSIHHNPDYFPRPFSFTPERWLPEEQTSQGLSLAQSAFTPFGVGRTSCVGKHLAYQEMGLILAHLIFAFDIRLEPGSKLGEGRPGWPRGRERVDEFQIYEHFASSSKGPMVQFKLRAQG